MGALSDGGVGSQQVPHRAFSRFGMTGFVESMKVPHDLLVLPDAAQESLQTLPVRLAGCASYLLRG
jgi:hypothetical protein